MDALQLSHVVTLVVVGFHLVSVVPVSRIVHRLGLNPAWSLLYFIPVGGLVGLWFLAWGRWPSQPTSTEQASVF